MGMYDYIRCQMPLPAEPAPPSCEWFQTKDTDAQYLECYTITEDGRLIHHSVRYEDVPQSERPYPDVAPGTWQSICGILKSVPDGDIEIPYSGAIEFYHLDDATSEWWGYTALFENGRCVNLINSSHDLPVVGRK